MSNRTGNSVVNGIASDNKQPMVEPKIMGVRRPLLSESLPKTGLATISVATSTLRNIPAKRASSFHGEQSQNIATRCRSLARESARPLFETCPSRQERIVKCAIFFQ